MWCSSTIAFKSIRKFFQALMSVLWWTCKINLSVKFVHAPIIVTAFRPCLFSLWWIGWSGCYHVFFSWFWPDQILVDDSSANITGVFRCNRLARLRAKTFRSCYSYISLCEDNLYLYLVYANLIPILLYVSSSLFLLIGKLNFYSISLTLSLNDKNLFSYKLSRIYCLTSLGIGHISAPTLDFLIWTEFPL